MGRGVLSAGFRLMESFSEENVSWGRRRFTGLRTVVGVCVVGRGKTAWFVS